MADTTVPEFDSAMLGDARDRYRIVESLGAGGMGEVFLAEDLVLRRKVAIKTIRHELCQNDTIRKRIEHECLLHARAGAHPNIVTLYDKIETEDRIFLVLEYVPGQTLHEEMRHQSLVAPRMPLSEAVDITTQVLDGLARIHAQGIIHRDIKPDNVFIMRDETNTLHVKLADFGIARIEDPAEALTRLTRTGKGSPGTPLYMAPEQIDKDTYGDTTHAADLYAVGIVFYQLIAGQPPFHGTLADILDGHTRAAVPPIDMLQGSPRGRAIQQVIQCALQKRPEERFASAREFHDALADAASLSGADAVETQAMPSLPFSEALQGPPTVQNTPLRPESSGGHPRVKLASVLLGVLILMLGAAGSFFIPRLLPKSQTDTPPHDVSPTPPAIPVPMPQDATTLSETPPAPVSALPVEPEGPPVETLSPQEEAPSQADEAVAPSEPVASSPPATYTVAQGDTLFGIAARFGLEMRTLARWNGIQEPFIVRQGQKLKLRPPSKPATEPPSPGSAEPAPSQPDEVSEQETDASDKPAAPKFRREGNRMVRIE